MDRLVYDALHQCPICPEQYPNVYRWRHSVALYPPEQRDKLVHSIVVFLWLISVLNLIAIITCEKCSRVLCQNCY